MAAAATAARWPGGWPAIVSSVLLGGLRPTRQAEATLVADAPLTMTVNSPVFTSGVIPAKFTCYGAGVSPPIFWSAPPPGTKSLALVVDDSATPISPRIYWLVFNISPATADLQDRFAAAARQGGREQFRAKPTTTRRVPSENRTSTGSPSMRSTRPSGMPCPQTRTCSRP